MKNTATTTTRFTLNFRMLARVEGRRWLSKIKRNAATTTHHSSSRKQPAPQTCISQSQVNRDTAFDLPTKEDKKTMITNLPQQPPKYTVSTNENDCEQQEGKSGEKAKNIKEKVSEERNQEEIGLKHATQEINEEKRKNPTQESIETQLRKAQRREVLLARLRARIQKSEARFMHVKEQNHTCCEEARG